MWPCESLPSGGGVTIMAGLQSEKVLGNADTLTGCDCGTLAEDAGRGTEQEQAENTVLQTALSAAGENGADGELLGVEPTEAEQECTERKQVGNVGILAGGSPVGKGSLSPAMHNERAYGDASRRQNRDSARKRVKWADERQAGPLAAAEDGSPYTERGLGLTAGSQQWTKKRVRRLSVEGVRGSRYKHRSRGRRGTVGFGGNEGVDSEERTGFKSGQKKLDAREANCDGGVRKGGELDKDALLERQAIVESVRELRARVSLGVGGVPRAESSLNVAKAGGEVGGQRSERGLDAPPKQGRNSGELSKSGAEVSAEGHVEGASETRAEARLQTTGTPVAILDGAAPRSSGGLVAGKEGAQTAVQNPQPSGKQGVLSGTELPVGLHTGVWQTAYRDVGNGFGAIQLSPPGAKEDGVGAAGPSDRGEENKSGESNDRSKGVRKRADGSERGLKQSVPGQRSDQEGPPLNAYNGRGVPAFQWLNMSRVAARLGAGL